MVSILVTSANTKLFLSLFQTSEVNLTFEIISTMSEDKVAAEIKTRKSRLQQFELQGVQETTKKLGQGSYAYVIEMEYRGLKCAGKKLHQFVQSNEQQILKRFEQECEILASLDHPNIVQFLGIHFPENSVLPTLVMEYMYTTLSSCLERYGKLPYEISYSILDEISLALCHLHENNPPIIHRDLTANNVLLTTDMRAKVGDLGVAKILDLCVDQRKTMTMCPGCPAYMPPEAQMSDPQYSTEIDCFSYGVLILHTFCAEWPIPDWVATQDSQDPSTLIALNEADRRGKYLSKLGYDHPLKELVLECLSNNPKQRPNAENIQKRVHRVGSRFPPLFENSLLILQENQKLMENIVQLNQQLTSLSITNLEPPRELDTTMNADLIVENQRLQSRLEDIQTKHSYETNQLRGDIKSMNTELVELNSKLISFEKQQSLQTTTLSRVQETLATKVRQLVTANSELTLKEQQLGNKEKQLDNLQKKYEAQEQHLAANKLEQEHRLKELEAMAKQFNALQGQLQAKEGQVTAKQKQCAATLQQLEAFKKETELKQEELKLATTKLSQAKTKEEELLLEIANKDELIKSSNAELDHIKGDRLPTLESQIEMKENSIKILSNQLERAQEYIYNEGKVSYTVQCACHVML